MEFSFAHGLGAHRDDVEISISTPFPELDRNTYAPIPVVYCARRRLIFATFLLARAFLWKRLVGWLGASADILVGHPELQALKDTDLVVDLSGDMLTEDYGPHVAYSHFLPVMTALAMGKPVILCAQSIGPFTLMKRLARYVLGQAALITAREPVTIEYLREIGVQNSQIFLTTDLSFLLEPAKDESVDVVLSREGIDLAGRQMIGISFSNLVHSHYRKRNPHASGTMFPELIAGILDTISERYGLQILFVPHVTGPRASADDRVFAEKISSHMQMTAVAIKGDYTPDILKGIISRCRLYMGARMHANIAAMSSGIPTLAIAYSHKTAGIMQLLGQDEYVCDIATLDGESVLKCFGRLYSRSDSVATTLRERSSVLKVEAAKNIELVSKFLDSIQADPRKAPVTD
jgi:colanic acid/amylovoran biosynthesis protein